MKKIKVAQVGVGNFGSYRRARMREAGLFELMAAYDVNVEALAQAEHGDGAQPVTSYDELLSTPGTKAVIISSGGMLFQCGVQTIHKLMFYFDPITHVSSVMRHDVHKPRSISSASG